MLAAKFFLQNAINAGTRFLHRNYKYYTDSMYFWCCMALAKTDARAPTMDERRMLRAASVRFFAKSCEDVISMDLDSMLNAFAKIAANDETRELLRVHSQQESLHYIYSGHENGISFDVAYRESVLFSEPESSKVQNLHVRYHADDKNIFEIYASRKKGNKNWDCEITVTQKN